MISEPDDLPEKKKKMNLIKKYRNYLVISKRRTFIYIRNNVKKKKKNRTVSRVIVNV